MYCIVFTNWPAVQSGLSLLTLKGNSTFLLLNPNELELEWHENTLAFAYPIKMLEAPLRLPEGLCRCQFHGGVGLGVRFTLLCVSVCTHTTNWPRLRPIKVTGLSSK